MFGPSVGLIPHLVSPVQPGQIDQTTFTLYLLGNGLREFLLAEGPDSAPAQVEYLAELLTQMMAAIIDRIDAVNEHVVTTSNARSTELPDSFRRRPTAVLVLALGLALAAISIWHILRLEKEAHER